MRKIWRWSIVIIGALLVVLIVVHIKTVSEKEFYCDNIDTIFTSSFAQLCNNMNIEPMDLEEESELYAENIKYSYLCCSLFSLTSYSENDDLNKIVHALYDMSEKNVLYENLNPLTAENLNRLCLNMNDKDLAGSVCHLLFDETGE